MTPCDLIRRLHAHRAWVNEKLIHIAKHLSKEQLQQSFPIGQGSVWKTLTHLFAAEYVWLEALLGNEEPLVPGDVPGELPGNQQGEGAMATLEELISRWDELAQRWNQYLAELTDKSLEDSVFKVSTSSGIGKRHGTKRCDVLMHVCTHAQYTTAQLINMYRHLGQTELPDCMFITMVRREAQTSQA